MKFFFRCCLFRPCLGPFVSFPRCTQLLSNFCGREGLKGHVRLAVMPAALSPLTLGVPFFNILPVKNQTPIRLKRSSFFLLLNLLSKKMNEKSWFSVFEQSEEMSWDLCLLKSLAKQSSFSSDLLAKTKKSPKGLVQQKQSGYNSIKIHTMWLILYIIFSSKSNAKWGGLYTFFRFSSLFSIPLFNLKCISKGFSTQLCAIWFIAGYSNRLLLSQASEAAVEAVCTKDSQ